MKRVFRWTLRVALCLALLAALALLLLDTVARRAVQKRLAAELGLEVQIEKVSVGIFAPTVNVQNLRILNPQDFGDSSLLHLTELHLEYDRNQLRDRKIYLTLLRLDIAEMSIITNQVGELNWDMIGKPTQGTAGDKRTGERAFAFDGIKTLEITWRNALLCRLQDPIEIHKIEIPIENEAFTSVRSREDVVTIATILALKSGIHLPLKAFSETAGSIDPETTVPPAKHAK